MACWQHGIFVGVRRRSGELWISVEDSVFAVRSVRRIPEEHRWGEDCVKVVNRILRNRNKDCECADGDVPEEYKAESKSESVV